MKRFVFATILALTSLFADALQPEQGYRGFSDFEVSGHYNGTLVRPTLRLGVEF